MSTFGIAARLIAFRLNRVRIVDGVLVGTSEDSITEPTWLTTMVSPSFTLLALVESTWPLS